MLNDDKELQSSAVDLDLKLENTNKELKLGNNTHKELESVDVQSTRTLTPKNRLFLQLLSEGRSTYEAYELAGYKGEKHAAYELRSSLNSHLKQLLQGRGIDVPELMMELQKLNSLPLREQNISVKDKISLLKLYKSVVDADKPLDNRPKITAFVINAQPIQQVRPSETIDTSIAE